MSSYREPRLWRVPGRLVVHLIDGLPWTVSHVRPNNLRQHCRQLARTFRLSNPIADRLRPWCRRLFEVVADRSGLLTQIHPSEFRSVAVLIRMAWYAEEWRHSPEDWWPEATESPRDQWRSLLRHLFGPYSVPAFFESAWLVEGPLSCPERDWYCLAVAGKSLRRAPGMPSSVSARALHLAMQAPADLTIRQALRWGQLRALGCPPCLWKFVLTNRMAVDFNADRVWLRLLAKVATTRSGLRDFGKVVDLLAEQIRPSGGRDRTIDGPDRAHQLVGLPWRELRRHAGRFWRELLARSQEQGVNWRGADLRSPVFRLRLAASLNIRWDPLPDIPLSESVSYPGWSLEIRQVTRLASLMGFSRKMKGAFSEYANHGGWDHGAVFAFTTRDQGMDPEFWCVANIFTYSGDVYCPRSFRSVSFWDAEGRWLFWRGNAVLRDWVRRHGLD